MPQSAAARRPEPSEYDPLYGRYIALVEDGPIDGLLAQDQGTLAALLRNLSPVQADRAYAPGKWTVKQVVGHIIDTERNFAYRLLRAARGDPAPLPGYDDEAWARTWDVSGLPLGALLEEFEAVRAASIRLVAHLSPADWDRQITANGSRISVRALAYLLAGHERHHRRVLEQHYLGGEEAASCPAVPTSPVIVALDVDSGAEALSIVDRLGPQAQLYKVGLQLLIAEGPSVFAALHARGKQVLLDAKLHEIPQSVAAAVTVAGRHGLWGITVHASAGPAVLEAAVRAARPFPHLHILALTVITSLADQDLPAIGLAPSVDAQVRRLAALAAASGCHGVIASPLEVAWLRAELPAQLHLVTPGVQLPGEGAADHRRAATPETAARGGATSVIVGRTVTQAPDPARAFEAALESFARGAAEAKASGLEGHGEAPAPD